MTGPAQSRAYQDLSVLVGVRIENTYSCGRTSQHAIALVAPVSGADLDEWFTATVFDHTGDGYGCAASDNAIHEATITETPAHRRELLGASYTWN